MSYESRNFRPRQDVEVVEVEVEVEEEEEGSTFCLLIGNRYRGSGGGRYQHTEERKSYRGSSNRAPSPSKDDEVEDIEVRLKSLIIKIGDKISPELQVNLNKMKNILDNDYSKYPETVQNTLKACISDIPAKAPVYGILLGLLNLSNYESVAKLMDTFNQLFKETVERSEWFKLKQLVRFYGELMNANVITSIAYTGMINTLLSVVDEPRLLKDRTDCIVYIVLSVLPWSMKELHHRSPEEMNQIIAKIQYYMERRGSVPTLRIMQRYQSEEMNAKEKDPLEHLWHLIQELHGKGGDVPLLPKPFHWFDEDLKSAVQHDLFTFEVPPHSDDIKYFGPQRILRVLVDENNKTLSMVPDHDSLDYFILNDMISDTIQIFESNRKECAKYLLGIAHSFEYGFINTTAASHENEPDTMDEDTAGWSLSDLLLESIFSQILKLPTPPFRLVFYSCILTELCRTESSSFPMALGRIVKTLFGRMHALDAECVSRLWSWFSHHLSNFGLQWDWKSWNEVLALDPMHPQACFIRETLEKEIRLSYYERIKTTIPEEFAPLFPPVAPGPDFEYKEPSHPLHSQAKLVIESLRAKKTVEEVREILNVFKEDQAKRGLDEQAQLNSVRVLFVQCLLLVGSKSFSHVLNVVERYLEVIRYVNSTPEGRLHTVQIVSSFWKNNTQFLGILLDKLLNYRVIDPTSVITWTFESEQLEKAGRAYPWEILKNTLNKVVSRVIQVRLKLENFQELHTVNETKRASTGLTEMAQAEAQQELDTLRIVENSLTTVTREQKEVFMVIYQKFTHTLQELIVTCNARGQDPATHWTYWWVSGWYTEMLRLYQKECSGFLVTLETLVFLPTMDARISSVFEDVKAMNTQANLIL
ncbi:armadillo-type protein [Spinellus fusiger]|nr:armadillo-type protein [Spinellus fusiger]